MPICMPICMPRLLSIALLALLSLAAAPASQPNPLPAGSFFVSSNRIALNVSPDASIEVVHDGVKVGAGKLEAAEAESMFDANWKSHVPLGTYKITSLKRVNNNTLSMVHQYPELTVSFNVVVLVEDIQINVRVVNNSKSKRLNFLGVRLPIINFSRNATGNVNSWHWTYLRDNGPDLMHPSYRNPTSGVFAHDDRIGVGLSTSSHLQKRSVFLANWQANDIIPKDSEFLFFCELGLEAGDGKSFDCTMRVSKNRDWKYLLANYANAFKSQFPPQTQAVDVRPWSFFASADTSWVTPSNPFGFDGENRRFDTSEGTGRFISNYVVPVAGVCQGMMMWAPQGVHPRGAAYRSDFDIFPPPIQANIPRLVAACKAAGLRIGLATRPSQLIWPQTYTGDNVVTLDGRNADQLNALWRRFDAMIQQGYTAFYLDSFGRDYNDFLIARFLRGKFGPGIPTYSEYITDVMMPYTGMYGELLDAEGNLRWMSSQTMQILRWLSPQLPMMVKDMTGDVENAYKNKCTPCVIDYIAAGSAGELKRLNERYINANNTWK